MVEAGDSAEHARAMYDHSVTAVVVAAFALAALASIGLAVLLARMLARPLADVGAAARRIATATTPPASHARARRSSSPSPTPSTRWPPASSGRRRCGATSSPTRRTSSGRR